MQNLHQLLCRTGFRFHPALHIFCQCFHHHHKSHKILFSNLQQDQYKALKDGKTIIKKIEAVSAEEGVNYLQKNGYFPISVEKVQDLNLSFLGTLTQQVNFNDIVNLIKVKPKNVELVLTGRKATPEVMATLTLPVFPSFVNKAQVLFLSIVQAIQQGETQNEVRDLCQKYVDHYFWIKATYLDHERLIPEKVYQEAMVESKQQKNIATSINKI